MIGIVLLLMLGIGLSACFSGTETGFYRVTRVRLVLDGVSGSRISRGLLWLSNHPAIFVSTALVGNAIANYLVSLGIVMLTSKLWGNSSGPSLEILMTMVSTPVLFIYGELLPKHLFYLAPYRLLKITGPLFLVISIAIAPISIVLYGINLLIQRLVGEAPLKIRPALARKELQQILQEGQEAGLLLPLQRTIAQNIFAFGGSQISQYCMPLRGLRNVASDAPLEDLEALAERSQQAIIAVVHPTTDRLVGYYRVADIAIMEGQTPKLFPVVTFAGQTTQVHAMTEMVSKRCELAKVVDANGKMIGVVTLRRLLAQALNAAS